MNWLPGEPNGGRVENCGERAPSHGRWHDIDCAWTREYYCEGDNVKLQTLGHFVFIFMETSVSVQIKIWRKIQRP